MTHTPKTPIEKIGDHLLLYAGDALEERAIPIASIVLTTDYGDLIVTVPGGGARISGWTIPEILRVMYPPVSLATVDLPPMAEADWDLDLSEIEDKPAPHIRPGALPARILDQLDDDWASASSVAERLGGVAVARVSQALLSLCDRGLAERAKHPITGRYMYRATGVEPAERKVVGSPLADDIIGALRRYGSPMAARQIVEALPDRNVSSLRHALYRMVHSGQLRKEPHPVYGVSVYSIADEEAGQ